MSSVDWRENEIYLTGDFDPNYTLLLVALYSRLCAFQSLLLHASFVDYGGRGLIFVGDSGVGKTTQAELWARYAGAEIVNGDKAFLRCFAEGIYAYGSPWRGSSPYCLNRRAPVEGVISLRQAGENRIRRLAAPEVMEYFVPHVFLPQWDGACMEQALATLDRVVSSLPIFLLECRPDEEAVQLARRAVFGA